jgi:hypothetical protein
MQGSQGYIAETSAANACVFPGGGGSSALGGGAVPAGGANGNSTGAAGVAGINGVGGGGSGAFQTDSTARAGGFGGFGGVYVLEYANSNGIGDLIGPSVATDNAIARYDTITGKQLQNSGVTISDTADVAGAKTLAMSGATSGTLTLQPAATTSSLTLTPPSAQGILGAELVNDGSGSLSWAAPAQTGLFWSAQANGDPRTNQTTNATFNGNANWSCRPLLLLLLLLLLLMPEQLLPEQLLPEQLLPEQLLPEVLMLETLLELELLLLELLLLR